MTTSNLLEYKMNSWFFRSAVNIILALCIFVSAWLGSLIGIQSQALNISFIWPATGISLAAILLFGFRVWPGIFLGNLFHNYINIYIYANAASGDELHLYNSLMIGSIIALGSLSQALLAGYIIRKLSSIDYFQSIKDIVIFLVPAGLVASVIAATVGVTTLFLNGLISYDMTFVDWLTFWVGDSMGVYIFTPLIVVWTLHRLNPEYWKYTFELILMIATLGSLYLLNFVWTYPLAHLYIPLAMWATFRFRMHGATLAIFFISLCMIIPTSMGFGTFQANLESNQLFVLATWLMIIVTISLILAAVINERKVAWDLLKNDNVDLQKGIDKYLEKIKLLNEEVLVKGKLASLGMVSLGIARKLNTPFDEISKVIAKSQKCIKEAKTFSKRHANLLGKENTKTLYYHITNLEKEVAVLSKQEKKAKKIMLLVNKLSETSSLRTGLVKEINVHTMLNCCLQKTLKKASQVHPEFHFDVRKEFDRNVKMITGFPQELEDVFLQLIEKSVESMYNKYIELGTSYQPDLSLKTNFSYDCVEVVFHHNGISDKKDAFFDVSKSFVTPEESLQKSDYTLLLAHDVIVHFFGGELQADNLEDETFEISITLPV